MGPEVLEVKMEKPEELPLEKADVVIAGGWGIGSEENWKMIEELANSCGIALLPVDGSAAARLLAAYPAYSQGVIPAGSYNGQDQDVPTIGVKAVLLASDELSENTVKALTKTLYDGVDTLQAELGLPLELGPADKIGVPVHAGAAAYYQENGMAAGEDAA